MNKANTGQTIQKDNIQTNKDSSDKKHTDSTKELKDNLKAKKYTNQRLDVVINKIQQ